MADEDPFLVLFCFGSVLLLFFLFIPRLLLLNCMCQACERNGKENATLPRPRKKSVAGKLIEVILWQNKHLGGDSAWIRNSIATETFSHSF